MLKIPFYNHLITRYSEYSFPAFAISQSRFPWIKSMRGAQFIDPISNGSNPECSSRNRFLAVRNFTQPFTAPWTKRLNWSALRYARIVSILPRRSAERRVASRIVGNLYERCPTVTVPRSLYFYSAGRWFNVSARSFAPDSALSLPLRSYRIKINERRMCFAHLPRSVSSLPPAHVEFQKQTYRSPPTRSRHPSAPPSGLAVLPVSNWIDYEMPRCRADTQSRFTGWQ